MKINRLVIENFKSIERIELIEPNPFTVFVGPNGSGKSNIFEALEFVNLRRRVAKSDVISLFGGGDNFLRRQSNSEWINFKCDFEDFTIFLNESFTRHPNDGPIKFLGLEKKSLFSEQVEHSDYEQFYNNFSRLFISNKNPDRLPLNDNRRLLTSVSNLEKVIMRVLSNPVLKTEIFEWLDLFVPGFESVAIAENPFDGKATLLWFENFSDRPFTKDLISDGTYNILALLTAVYQSEKPQFLCLEEPENGLNPKVVKEFVNLCRYACEEFGHYIWLNTHSQTLVSQLTTKEIILVDKKAGSTQIKQIQDMNLHDLPMDEAWLSNALGGGIPW